MTGDELKSARRGLGYSARRFAEVFGASDGRIVRRWERGDYPVPRTLALLLRLVEMHPAARESLEVMSEGDRPHARSRSCP